MPEGRKVQHWCAGSNVGSYSSDPDNVMHGGTIADAVAHLRDQLEHARDYGPEEDAASFAKALEALDAIDEDELEKDANLRRGDGGHWSVPAHDWWYWIMPCFTIGCDQVEADGGE